MDCENGGCEDGGVTSGSDALVVVAPRPIGGGGWSDCRARHDHGDS